MSLLVRIMESEVGAICVALAMAFAPVAILEVAVWAGVPVGGSEPDMGPR